MIAGSKLLRLIVLVVPLLIVSAVACDEERPAPDTEETVAQTRVLIVHSYDEGFGWTREQQRGIVEGLQQSGFRNGENAAIETFLMDTRITYTSPEQIADRADEALQLIDTFRPDLVFVTDDVALQHVAVAYREQHPADGPAFVFSGVNGDPTTLPTIGSLARPGGRITGTLKRIPFLARSARRKRSFPTLSRS